MLKLLLWLQYLLSILDTFFWFYILLCHRVLKLARFDHITKHINYRITPRSVQMTRIILSYITIHSIIIIRRIVSEIWLLKLLLWFENIPCRRGVMASFIFKRWRCWRNRNVIRTTHSLWTFFKIIRIIWRFFLNLLFSIRIFLNFCKITAFSWLIWARSL